MANFRQAWNFSNVDRGGYALCCSHELGAIFHPAWEISKVNEGGYAFDPNDAGGETYRGIARRYEKNWSGWVLIDQIKKSTGPIKTNWTSPELDRHAEELYKQKYWSSIGGDRIANQSIANTIYDSALSGLPRTIVMIKYLLNKKFKGKFDDTSTMTQAVVDAINQAPAKSFYDEFNAYRAAMFKYSAGALKAGDPYFFLRDLFKRFNSKSDEERAAYGSLYLTGWLARVTRYANDTAIATYKAVSNNSGKILAGVTVIAAAGVVWYYRKPIKEKLAKIFVKEKLDGFPELNKKNLLIAGAATLAVIGMAAIAKKPLEKGMDYVMRYAMSASQKEILDNLHPDERNVFKKFIDEVWEKLGYNTILTTGYRTFQHQVRLKKEDERNASPGFSMHNYGLAIDLNFQKGNQWLKKASPKSEWIKSGVVAIAKKYGLFWGGDFADYADPVHFDLRNKYDIKKLHAQAVKQFGSAEKAIGNRVLLPSTLGATAPLKYLNEAEDQINQAA